MAKTIDRENNSAASATDEAEPMDESTAEYDAETADMPEAEQEMAVAPLDEERVVTRTGAAGVQVPEPLLKNPLTRGLAEAYIELRKVNWPTRQDTWNMTLVVIIVSALMSVLLALSDYGLGHLLSYLVNLGLGR
ncbi:MAG TPA: preprotein translocase subunit SecE [Ktedonobacterales bacterium]